MLFAGPAESDRGEHLMTLANPSRVVGALTLQSVHNPRTDASPMPMPTAGPRIAEMLDIIDR